MKPVKTTVWDSAIYIDNPSFETIMKVLSSLGFIGKGTLGFADVESLIQGAPYDIYRPGKLSEGLETAYRLWTERV